MRWRDDYILCGDTNAFNALMVALVQLKVVDCCMMEWSDRFSVDCGASLDLSAAASWRASTVSHFNSKWPSEGEGGQSGVDAEYTRLYTGQTIQM